MLVCRYTLAQFGSSLSRICRSPALAVSFIISPPRRRVGNVICLGRALFAPRLASRALSVLNNNQGMRSRRARLLARVAAPNRSHTLAWHASDRGPRFSLSRGVRGGAEVELHRQREELPCESCMASRRGSRHVSGRGRRVAAKPLLACMSCRLALPTQSTAAIYVHRHRLTALTYSRVHLLHR